MRTARTVDLVASQEANSHQRLSAMAISATAIEAADELAVNAARYERHLRASGLLPKTEGTDLEGVTNLGAFLVEQGMPTATESVTREHLEEWLIAMREAGRKPTTIAARYRSVQQFFKWAAEEGLIRQSPMATMRPPKIPESARPVIRDEQLVALLKVIEADKSFAGRRDAAILRVFVASGARLAEVANLRWTPAEPTTNDVDLDSSLIRVQGKGGRERQIWVGAKAVKALDRYVFDHRARHRLADQRWLWLGPKGRFTPSGIAQMGRAWGSGRHRRAPSACVPPRLGARQPRAGDAGRRGHDAGRVAEPGNSAPVRRVDGDRGALDPARRSRLADGS